MAEEDPGLGAPRALPVAAAAVDRLEQHAEGLARRWAAELLLTRPLGSLGRIALEELTSEAPGLCRQVLRAVRSEEDLRLLLTPEPPERGTAYADRPAALAGVRDPGDGIEVVELLRGVIWEAMLGELSSIPGDRLRERLTADLSDRLAHVCASLGAVLAGRELPVASARPARFPERPPGPRIAPERRIVIVDELGLPPAGGGGERQELPSGEGPETGVGGAASHPDIEVPGSASDLHAEEEAGGTSRAAFALHRADTEAPSRPRQTQTRTPVPVPPGAVEIAIRDTREEAGPAAWVDAIGSRLERYAQELTPFAVVLMELTGARRVAGHLERALNDELRLSGGGTLTREREGRYWLVVQRSDRIGATALASELERVATATAVAAGVTVTVSSGTAVCPEDGTRAAELAAHADVGLHAARWQAQTGEGG